VLDIAPEIATGAGADPVANHATIERELAAHDAHLAHLPRLLVLSKADLLTAAQVRATAAEWGRRLGGEVAVIATSSATGTGIAQLAGELLRRVEPAGAAAQANVEEGRTDDRGAGGAARGRGESGMGVTRARGARARTEEELAEHMVFRPAAAAGFQVERLGARSFAVRGKGIERLLARYDVENEDAMAYVEERLRRIGVLRALQEEGFRAGDEIEIGGVTFELDPSAAAQ
jgi:GTPase